MDPRAIGFKYKKQVLELVEKEIFKQEMILSGAQVNLRQLKVEQKALLNDLHDLEVEQSKWVKVPLLHDFTDLDIQMEEAADDPSPKTISKDLIRRLEDVPILLHKD